MGVAGCSGPPKYPLRPLAPAAKPTEGVDHGSGTFKGARDTDLFEQWWKPKGGGARSTVVIVHGLKDHSSRYEELAERLVKQKHSVYAFDLRGHAHSAGARVDIESFDDYLDDLTIFMKRVRAQEGNTKVFLLGHSMGGAIVTLWTMKNNPPLAGLITSAGALRVDVSFITSGGTSVMGALFPHAGVFNLDIDLFSRDPNVVKACKADPLVYQDSAPARTAKYLLGAIDYVEDHRAQIHVPLLALHGEKDEVTDPKGSADLVAQAVSKDKHLRVYKGLVHDLLHEPEKEIVIRDVAAWIEARSN